MNLLLAGLLGSSLGEERGKDFSSLTLVYPQTVVPWLVLSRPVPPSLPCARCPLDLRGCTTTSWRWRCLESRENLSGRSSQTEKRHEFLVLPLCAATGDSGLTEHSCGGAWCPLSPSCFCSGSWLWWGSHSRHWCICYQDMWPQLCQSQAILWHDSKVMNGIFCFCPRWDILIKHMWNWTLQLL